MGIPLLFIAALLIVAAMRNELGQLATHASQDVAGAIKWLGAIAVIGAIGLIPTFQKVSNALFFLVFIVFFLKNKGIFDNIKSGSAFTPQPLGANPSTPITPGTQAATPPGVKGYGTLTQPPGIDPATGAPAGAATTQTPFGQVIQFPGNPLVPQLPKDIFAPGIQGSGNSPQQGVAGKAPVAPDNSGVTIEDIQISPNGL